MKVKKGKAWLKREFEKQLATALDQNHVVDLSQLVGFKGREELIIDMVIRDDIEEAIQGDIDRQERIDSDRKEVETEAARRLKTVKNEEKELWKKIGDKHVIQG